MAKVNCVIIFLLISLNNLFSDELLSGKIISVIDGDTIKFLNLNKETIKVRLSQIDAPEFKSEDEPKKNQNFGEESKESLTSLCEGKTGSLDIRGTDRYQRTLAILICENVNANIHQLKNGMAWVFDKYVTDYNLYEFQNTAKLKKVGIWSEEFPLAPWDFRAGKKEYDHRLEELEKKLEDLISLTEQNIIFYQNEILELNKKLEGYKNTSDNKNDFISCAKKTCKQMLNCEEAYFQYKECGNSSLDRDKDGVPCESICN